MHNKEINKVFNRCDAFIAAQTFVAAKATRKLPSLRIVQRENYIENVSLTQRNPRSADLNCYEVRIGKYTASRHKQALASEKMKAMSLRLAVQPSQQSFPVNSGQKPNFHFLAMFIPTPTTITSVLGGSSYVCGRYEDIDWHQMCNELRAFCCVSWSFRVALKHKERPGRE